MNPGWAALGYFVLAIIVGGGEGAWFSGFLTACGIAVIMNSKVQP